MDKIPVLFVIFNRPELTIETFKVIKKYQPTDLYIAADGARKWKNGEKEKCDYTRKVILEQIDWECNVHKLFREENVGCGLSVSGGISWMFESEDYGIVIEDDCSPSLDFFLLCENLLPRYKDCENIMQINGFNPVATAEAGSGYSFSRYPKIWGWATWKRAWAHFDISMKEWESYRKSNRLSKQFPFWERWIHQYVWDKYYKELQKVKSPRTWGIQWSVSIFSRDGLCIVPDTNLVVNTGEGIEATNCDVADPLVSRCKLGKFIFPVRHPERIELDVQINEMDSDFYMKRKISVRIQRIKRFLKNLLK